MIVKSFDNFSLVHGTRDYYRGIYGGFKVEFVPSIKYLSPDLATNSADISYFHIKYLKSKFEKNPELKDEVLLLKQFLKANDIYGAESARAGFSGYVCELMIIYFGSFYNIMEYFESAKPKVVIDIEKHYKDSSDVIHAMDKNKASGPLIIVDPQLPLRNAASCVSFESFAEFVFRLRTFLRKKNMNFFKIRGVTLELIKERSLRRETKLIYFTAKNYDDFDIFKAKAYRKMKQISSMLENEGYSIYSFGITDNGEMYFEFESIKVSKAKKHLGPFAWCDASNFDEFMRKWELNGISKPYCFDTHLAIDVNRNENIKGIIKEYLSEFL
jgi:tRNA nucleotidyltransferase (CCA-adding enzyme)